MVAAVLSLAVLLAGLISSDVDALQNHAHRNNAFVDHPENGDTHLVRNQAAEEHTPCNACFFRTLVGHCLIPQKLQIEAVRVSSRHFNSLLARSFQSFFPREENRGPPR